ncbi:dTDP-glucose 4,6-dehydratase [Actinorhabdospora filicis]|uniref:dTDP-glucose 4,6-dehydratase n=1 Tax=Actinorhabdospora filicis TaxID=1785913 RepID=A0A9W6STF8_9ACTN|nr:NAD-dependent epimerase/dehydratase family protein [Actinorhabdospora filicis]GLZ81645.1 dTDP-glucose 4,6-dehydratase [Actinorhabdospora filicis]
MRILLAGATGVIGRPLVTALEARGHEVVAITRRPRKDAVVADVLDRDALLKAVAGLRADVIVQQLTALAKPPRNGADLAATNRLRTEGTANLLAVARETGATRYIGQSMFFGYGLRPGRTRPITEDEPFGETVGGGMDAAVFALRDAENLPFAEPGLDAVALRYGMFYGTMDAMSLMVGMVRKRMLPLPRGGTGLLSLIHVDDAVSATVAAIERGRGGEAYNIADDEPVGLDVYVDALARAVGARRPLRVPVWLLRVLSPYFATMATGTSLPVSNAKAARELDWRPRRPSYREGLAELVVEA